MSAGTFTSCGLDATGFAYCWGANQRGQIGAGDTEGSISPRRVESLLEFESISAGLVQTCAVTVDGIGYCWGDNTFGQLGVSPAVLTERCAGAIPCSTRPIRVFGEQRFRSISTGFGSHSCGVTVGGNLYCWGLGISGQRGDGTTGYWAVVPIRVAPAVEEPVP